MSTAEEKFREDLTAHLLEVATGNGYLNGILLNTPDLDEAWQRYAPSFYPDAVREFNGYPEFCLACAGYLGMAVAHLWDKDWTKYRETPYRFFQGERGFDDMDDHQRGKALCRRNAIPFGGDVSFPDEIRRRGRYRRSLSALSGQHRSPVQDRRSHRTCPSGLSF